MKITWSFEPFVESSSYAVTLHVVQTQSYKANVLLIQFIEITMMLLLGLVFVLLVTILCLLNVNKSKGAPPGPRAIPIIGHLHLFVLSFKEPSHKVFHELSRRYGPIFFLRFGSSPIVVASTADAAKEFLKNHDATFASRPRNLIARVVVHDSDLNFAPYGDRWRQLRKLATLEMFTTRRINIFKESRRNEVKALCESALVAASSATLFDAREAFTTLTFNIVTTMLMSKRFFGSNSGRDSVQHEATLFIDFMDELGRLGAQFVVGDYFPLLRFADPVESKIKVVAKVMNDFLDSCILEREKKRQSSPDRTSDFLDLLLDLRDQGEKHLQGPAVRALMMDIVAAGTDTSGKTLEWTLAEMIKHPEVMAKAQEELERVVGRRRTVEESDIPELKYLQAIVKESMRFHVLVPLLLPHHSIESCNVLGYNIPKDTTLLVNWYAIARDPSLWGDPLVFRPERFLESEIDVKGQHFELIPFGAGRRMCPGMALALTTVHLGIASLVHMFDWKESDDVKIDITSENYGITMTMANKLQAIPVRRQ